MRNHDPCRRPAKVGETTPISISTTHRVYNIISALASQYPAAASDPCSRKVRVAPASVEPEWHQVSEVDRRHRPLGHALGVNDHEVRLVPLGVVHEAHQPPCVFGRGARSGHKDGLLHVLALSRPPQLQRSARGGRRTRHQGEGHRRSSRDTRRAHGGKRTRFGDCCRHPSASAETF